MSTFLTVWFEHSLQNSFWNFIATMMALDDGTCKSWWGNEESVLIIGFSLLSWWVDSVCYHGGWIQSAIMVGGFSLVSWWVDSVSSQERLCYKSKRSLFLLPFYLLLGYLAMWCFLPCFDTVRRLSPHVNTLILDFTASRTVKNKFPYKLPIL
jgi:hypothetical protein